MTEKQLKQRTEMSLLLIATESVQKVAKQRGLAAFARSLQPDVDKLRAKLLTDDKKDSSA